MFDGVTLLDMSIATLVIAGVVLSFITWAVGGPVEF
jgi:hypothetical protein